MATETDRLADILRQSADRANALFEKELAFVVEWNKERNQCP